MSGAGLCGLCGLSSGLPRRQKVVSRPSAHSPHAHRSLLHAPMPALWLLALLWLPLRCQRPPTLRCWMTRARDSWAHKAAAGGRLGTLPTWATAALACAVPGPWYHPLGSEFGPWTKGEAEMPWAAGRVVLVCQLSSCGREARLRRAPCLIRPDSQEEVVMPANLTLPSPVLLHQARELLSLICSHVKQYGWLNDGQATRSGRVGSRGQRCASLSTELPPSELCGLRWTADVTEYLLSPKQIM